MDVKAVLNKIVSFLLSALAVFGIKITLPAPDPNLPCEAEATITFENETPGSAAGTVTLNASPDGEYTLYWGDKDDNKLTAHGKDLDVPYTEFVTVEVKNGKGSADLNDFLAIPAGAESVLVYRYNMLGGSCQLPDEKLYTGESTYNFGTLSDLHFNRYDDFGKGDDATVTFPLALDFLDAFDVTMVGMSGDLSKDGEKDAYEKFNNIVSEYDFPVFTCKGNHDCREEYTLENWQTYVNTGVYGKDKLPGVVSVADNGLDFVYCGEETHGDVFIFFSQINNTYFLPTERLVTDAQLDWLEKQLETYKDKRVYLFFHTFLSAESGNPMLCEGNLMTKTGSFYLLPFTKGAKDEVRFRNLMKTYKNVTFFNGHSHWAYYLQSINSKLNITDYDGSTATMVHISSVTNPRISSDSTILWTSSNTERSEGYLVTVYPDRYVLTACDFLQNQMLGYATYVVMK